MAVLQRFFGFEGIDGSGKGTQCELVAERLRMAGKEVTCFDFPRYGQASAVVIEMYLRGELGVEIGPKLASTLYASDRLAASPEIYRASLAGCLALTNRFTLSNAAFQGCQIDNKEERVAFYEWLFNLEHHQMGIPQPMKYIYLRIEPDISQMNVDLKPTRTYTEGRDIIESDLPRLIRARDVYDELCELYPGMLVTIDCMATSTTMRPIRQITDDLVKAVTNLMEV